MNSAVHTPLSPLRKLKRMLGRKSQPADDQYPPLGLTAADLEKLAARDRETWDRQFGLLYPLAFRTASGLLQDKKRADALAKDGLTKLFGAPSAFDDESHLRGLVTLAVRNLFIDENEKESFHRSEEVVARIKEEYDEQFEMRDQDPRSCAEKNELKRALEQIIELFPKEEYRRYIELQYLKGMTIDEIVEVTQKPRGSVSADLSRAREVLRRLMKHHPQMSEIVKERFGK